MTLLDLIRSLFRYRPILLLGLVATPAIGYLAMSNNGVYTTRTSIVFLAPTSTLYPNALETQSEDIIVTAGVVAKRITGPGEVLKFASPDVTLVGLGVRDGWSLRLPDTGGQWGANFASQTLILDIVALDPAKVEEQRIELVARVANELDSIQRDAGVNPVNYITVTTAPETSIIHHVGMSKYRVLGMCAVLGGGITLGVVLLLEHRRRTKSAPTHSRGIGKTEGHEQLQRL